ncbi:pentapeptide repeat protein [Staphylococcus phage vB_SauM_VL10]|nr:pentapeptide repeat protein [Staphylococcus phage vB_SauM_VL10]
MKTMTRKELNKILEEHELWLESNGAEGQRADLKRAYITKIKRVAMYSIDNIGTFKGKVTYIPSLDTVFAGCWNGNLEEFLEKGLKMNEGKEADKIKKAYEFFKVCKD